MGSQTFVVTNDESGQRLDRWLAVHLPEVSRQRLQEWIEVGGVQVNGNPVKPAYRVRAGDRLSVQPVLDRQDTFDLQAEPIPLQVIYEDAHLLVINKPRGLAVHPSPGHSSGTLVNALLALSPQLSTGDASFRPGIVHRLDKDTTGLLIVARDDNTHWKLSRALQTRQIDRRYLALVWGETKWEQASVDLPIGRHPVDRKRMAAFPAGTMTAGRAREACTDFKVSRRFKGFTLLEAKLHTGRTHQVRVHAAALGHPLTGDPLYGGERRLPKGIYSTARSQQIERLIANLSGQALHAYSLQFNHPITGERLCFTCPLPDEVERLLAVLEPQQP